MSRPTNTLVIGYGNTLRGDDAVGVLFAEQMSRENQAVRVVTAHQLVPELAAELAGMNRVFFVDAAAELSKPRWRFIRSDSHESLSWCGGHLQSPKQVLLWARVLDILPPHAWWLQLPADSFELGQPLSDLASSGIETAYRQLRRVLACRRLSVPRK